MTKSVDESFTGTTVGGACPIGEGMPGVLANEREVFERTFEALTGKVPFPWQWRLFERLLGGDWPDPIAIPTGLGKTSVMAVWVLALTRELMGLQGAQHEVRIPRRLAYVVDRRVVVDQASEEAVALAKRLEHALKNAGDPLADRARILTGVGCDDQVLAVSALRGQRTLDLRWRLDPARPAIIVGTVDMIGSRLLFSAYGTVGRWGRPYEAGLLGQDCLIVLDEAHLSQPFDDTLDVVEQMVGRSKRLRPFAVLRMGATTRPSPSGRAPLQLSEVDRHDPEIRKRLKADKRVRVQELGETEKLAELLVGWATERAKHEPSASIGLVLNTVREARAVSEELRKRLKESGLSSNDVLVLTGSMRGIERDDRVTDDKSTYHRRFRANRARDSAEGPAFLVATSSIEVGADIDLDHLATEACPLDSLVQRLGRVNRRGDRSAPSQVLVVVPTEVSGVARNVAEWLGDLLATRPDLVREKETVDGSPDGLPRAAAEELDRTPKRRAELCGAPPPVPQLGRAVVDDLAMTSLGLNDADRPDVSLWLRGCAPDDEGNYVELAWRMELEWVSNEEEAASLIEAFPPSPREMARCPMSEAVRLLERLQEEKDGFLVVVRDDDARGYGFESLPQDEAELFRLAAWSQIVLPCSAGGYRDGLIAPDSQATVADVADRALPETWAPRRRLWIEGGSVTAGDLRLEAAEVPEAWLADDPEALRTSCEGAARGMLGRDWDLVAATGSAERGVLVARRRRRRLPESAEGDRASVGFPSPVVLDQHLEDAGRWARSLCEKLRLDDVSEVIIEAARKHDLGKNRPWWQGAIGNTDGAHPLAKSGHGGFDHAVNAGYRHELGSLMDLLGEGASPNELVVHLVAAHHGFARPAFAPEAAGPTAPASAVRVIAEAASRFARLHHDWGPWALAYLEAVVKAADALASREVGS
jgi:CRISPR-associated endonuclease/helicase Cas3